jgi:hypothetical protein
MSRGAKIVLIGAGLVFAVALNATLLAGIAVYRVARHGAAMVSVHEKRPDGVQIRLPVPVGLVHLALRFVPRDEMAACDPELRRWLPAARSVVAEIDRAPDGVLVEVQTPNERVVIAKRDGKITVDVDTRDENVHISMAPGGLGEILDALSSRVGPPTGGARESDTLVQL